MQLSLATNMDVFQIPAVSDVLGSAQKPKAVKAEPRLAEPSQAVMAASQGLGLRLQISKAVSQGSGRGFLWLVCTVQL